MHDVIGVAQRYRYELGQVRSLKCDVTIDIASLSILSVSRLEYHFAIKASQVACSKRFCSGDMIFPI